MASFSQRSKTPFGKGDNKPGSGAMRPRSAIAGSTRIEHGDFTQQRFPRLYGSMVLKHMGGIPGFRGAAARARGRIMQNKARIANTEVQVKTPFIPAKSRYNQRLVRDVIYTGIIATAATGALSVANNMGALGNSAPENNTPAAGQGTGTGTEVSLDGGATDKQTTANKTFTSGQIQCIGKVITVTFKPEDKDIPLNAMTRAGKQPFNQMSDEVGQQLWDDVRASQDVWTKQFGPVKDPETQFRMQPGCGGEDPLPAQPKR